ncbi:MAG: hypothetical protein IKJ13_07775 [Clostridia bacterium]|nr:hypothetical protein [Clostridia bacterium]
MYIPPLLIVILIIVGFVVYSHNFDINGKKKAAPEPHFMKDCQKQYYNFVESFFDGMNYDFAARILVAAREQLKYDYDQYKRTITNKDYHPEQYFIDMFPEKPYPAYVHRAWAIVFIHFYLHKGIGGQTVWSAAEIDAHKKLKDEIDNLYAGIVEDGEACPKSFIEAFLPENYN